MKRRSGAALCAVLVLSMTTEPLLAYGRGGYSGGSVHAGSQGWASHSGSAGNSSTSWAGRGGNVSGSRTVSQTSSGYDVNKQVQTQSGASKDVNKQVNTDDGQVQSVNRSSTATNAYGESASRNRTTTNEGGYASVTGSASTSTGREASGQGEVGRNAYGQPVVAGTVDTKYSGDYAGAASRNAYGGWNTAVAGPNGTKVTTTLPSGYKTTTYAGTPYYGYGGAYYRPMPVVVGVPPAYYAVPPPYYYSYSTVPVGAIMVAAAGVSYMVAQGTYYKQTTSSQGTVVYQTVPAPVGAALQTLPAQRVLVTVGGTTYFLYANTFYRQASVGQPQVVVVTPPPGVVFVPALPADFQVVQLNTMYFEAQGHYYVRYMSPDGKELYVLVDTPPQPPASVATGPGAPAAPPPAPRTVAETLVVPTGTLILVRLAADLSSGTAHQGDRFQGFLGENVAANGKMIATRGSSVYGQVTSIEGGRKGQISAALTDVQVGNRVVPIHTQPVTATGRDATLSAQSLQSFPVAVPFEVQVNTQVAVR